MDFANNIVYLYQTLWKAPTGRKWPDRLYSIVNAPLYTMKEPIMYTLVQELELLQRHGCKKEMRAWLAGTVDRDTRGGARIAGPLFVCAPVRGPL